MIQDGQYCLPTFRDLQQSLSDIEDLVVYLFSVDDIPLYLIKSQDAYTYAAQMGVLCCYYGITFKLLVCTEYILR